MKRFIDYSSPRLLRLWYTVFALLVLTVSVYNLLHVIIWRAPSNDQCEWRQVYSDTTSVHVDFIEDSTSLFQAGDIIHSINGVSPVKANIASAMIQSAAPGDTLRIRVERDLRPRDVLLVRDTGSVLPFKLHDRKAETLIISNIVRGGVTDRAGAKDGDILLRIDGVSIRNVWGAQYLLNLHAAGSVARFTVDRNGQLLSYDVTILKVINYLYLSTFLLGFGFLLVGYIVVMARPDGFIQRKFANYGILGMLLFGLASLAIGSMHDSPTKINVMLSMFFAARVIAPPVFVTFFFHFPYRKRIPHRRWIVVALYALAAVGAVFLYLYIMRLLPWQTPTWFIRTMELLPAAYFFAGLVVFTHSYIRNADAVRRRQLRPILICTLIGVMTFIYIAIISTVYPLVIFLQPYLLAPAVLFIAIPPAFGYAIFKHRLMDVTFIVKRSLIYGLITAVIAAIYLSLVFGVGSVLSDVIGETDNTILTLIAFIVIALVFEPLKRRVQLGVDRVFYQERYNYQQALLEFSKELPSHINLDEILTSMVSRISNTMHVEKVAVVLCDNEQGCHAIGQNIPDQCCRFGHGSGGLLNALKETRAPLSVALINEDKLIVDAEDRALIEASGIVLIVPMFLQERLIGFINVGPKRSGKVYSKEDVDLLSTVGGQAAIAIENARLHRSEIEKQKIAEELHIAQRIQRGLLPAASPQSDTLDISGISIPAMTVGGDYYDYIQLADDRLLVTVGDVSGKGMSAALYMAKVQGMIRLAANVYATPREILAGVNRNLVGMEKHSFITLVLALFDQRARTVTICRAGHTEPLLALDGDVRFISSGGMGLGLERGDVFERSLEERTFEFHQDMLLLLYSDGLTEAMNPDMQLFGEHRLRRTVLQNLDLSASELQRTLLGHVESYRDGAEQNDDITMVVVRVRC